MGLQCPKALWIMFHEPDKIPEVDAATQHIFDQGHLVGELAKKWFPGGIDIPTDDFMGNIKKTKELLEQRKPLFEGGFMVDNLFARPDILNPVNDDEWDIIEVKSSTSVKEVNHHDVSFQKYCYEKAGLKIRKCFLMYINNQYVRQGEINYKELFAMQDITEEVDKLSSDIQERIDLLFKIIGSESCPNISINGNCTNPYACSLYDECWGVLPEDSVFDLIRGGKKSFELYTNGCTLIKEIPDEFKLTANQCIQRNCAQSGKNHIDKDAITKFLESVEYPVYYLDFETFNTAIPLYDGVKPYQQVPFQFSLHIQDAPNGELKHHEFLFEGKEDPRSAFMSKLKEHMGEKGSIIVYNQSFEISRLKECAQALPEFQEWVEALLPRFIDLIIPFRKFYYYNPIQKGSASIKAVLPAMLGKSYKGMAISDGGTASLEYLRITFGASDGTIASADDVKAVRGNLLKYCELDTEAMVWILEELMKLTNL